MKRFLLLVFLCLPAIMALGQSTVMGGSKKKGFVYKNEWSAGLSLNTNGWRIFGERAKILDIHRTRVFQLELAHIRRLKEKKTAPLYTYPLPSTETQRDYFYGKQNDMFVLRIGMGYRKMLVDKAERNGVKLALAYSAGFSLGLLKPYYLDIYYPINDSTGNEENFEIRTEKFSEENKDKFLDAYKIISASDFTKGLGEIKPVPGIYGKLGLNFDWASEDEFVKALEAGVLLDVYFQKVPIMVNENNNKPYFVGLYIGFQFGKRW